MAGPATQPLVERTIKNAISGTACGASVCLIGHPFDTLKVRLQTQPVHNPVYKGLADCFLKTIKWEGIGGLYKGVGSPLVGQMFFRATIFTAYYQIQNFLAGKERHGVRLETYEYFLCGTFTGFAAAFIEGPMDLFKTKMQIQIIKAQSGEAVQYRHVFHAGWSILKTHGIRGAYQGLGATFVRNLPANTIFFGFFELGRTKLTPSGGDAHMLSFTSLLLCGGFGGFFYWFLTYPTDVIKSAMMSDASVKTERKYSNILDCAIKLYRDAGWRRFFRGFTPCLMRSIPANAVAMCVLEKCRQWLA